MSEFRIENHLPHRTNTVETPGFPRHDWPERDYVPRAREETVAIIGLIRVTGIDIPIIQRRFTELVQDDGIPYDPHVLKIVSYETIAAAQRSGRPADDLAYPYGIVRDATGRVLGCRGFGMPQRFDSLGEPEPAITPTDIPRLGDPLSWENTTNFPFKLYNPGVVNLGSDLIDPGIEPILALPPSEHPVDVSPIETLDEARTEQFGVPIMRVQPNPGPNGITNLPHSPESLTIVHPIAYRHAVLLGESVRLCGVMGGLVRDRHKGTVLGSTAIYLPDPHMIVRDGM